MQNFSIRKPGFIIAPLLIANFIAQLMQTMLNIALPRIMNDMGVSEGEIQWLVTAYLLVSGIIISIAGFLIERFSTKALFYTSVSAFIGGTLLAALSGNFTVLLISRIIQALGTGLLLPLFQTTLLRVLPKEKIGAASGVFSFVLALAPALGPSLSGFIIQNHSWRLLFYILLPITVLNLVFAYFTLKSVGETRKIKIDIISVALSAFGFSNLLYGFGAAGEQGWANPYTWGTISAGLIILFLFIKRQLKLNQPLLNFNVFQNRMFVYSSIMGVVLFIVMVGTELLLPMYAQVVRGLSPRETGLMLLPGAFVIGISALVSGRLYDRYGVRPLVRGGFLFIAIISGILSIMLNENMLYAHMILLYTLLMLGIGFMLTPITAFSMASVPKHLVPHASPMNITMRMIGSAIGGAMLVTILTTQTNISALPFPENRIQGFQVAFWITTSLAILGFILSFYLKTKEERKRLNTEVSA